MGATRVGQNRFQLSVGAVETVIPLVRIQDKSVAEVTHIAVYNSHAAQTLTFYLGIRRGGKIHRHYYKATLAAADVENAYTSLYLSAGDEFVICVIASGAATTFEVVFQLLDVGKQKS